MIDPTPWYQRFDGLDDLEIIRSAIEIRANPLLSLSSLGNVEATKKLEIELERIFVPALQICQLLMDFVGIAKSRSAERYPSRSSYLAEVYGDAPPRTDSGTPGCVWCFTGLAGVGKSQLLSALQRLLSSQATLHLNAEHPCVHNAPVARLVISRTSNEVALLRELSGPAYKAKSHSAGQVPRLREHVRGYRFRVGTVLLLLDEMQFLTQSQNANALAAKVLTAMMSLDMPVVFAANYSLVWRLLKRPSEERQRLLCRPVGMAPDSANSECWLGLLAEYFKAAPEFFSDDLLSHAVEIHRLTGGLPRALKRLLVVAVGYAHQNKHPTKIAIGDLRAAYASATYAAHRTEIETLLNIAIAPHTRRLHPDLVCPIEGLFKETENANAELAKAGRGERVAQAVMEGALTKDERRELKKLREAATTKEATKSRVVQIRPKTELSVDTLAAGSRVMAKHRGKADPNTERMSVKDQLDV